MSNHINNSTYEREMVKKLIGYAVEEQKILKKRARSLKKARRKDLPML